MSAAFVVNPAASKLPHVIWCVPCKNAGREKVKAHRVFQGGWGMCNECFEAFGRPVINFPRPKPEEKTGGTETMPIKKDVDWNAIRKERSEGVPTGEIAKRYGIHVSTIYLHAKSKGGGGRIAPGKSNGRPHANGKVRLEVSSELLDRLWSTLAPEKKAELLGQL